MSRFNVKKVAVLGAGVMGAQIAAHLFNVRVPVVLFDLAAKDGPKNGIVLRAIDNLKKQKPAPLGDVADAVLIEVANYEDDLAKLGDCDLVIEAIAERMDWKLDLYRKIAPHVAKNAILASNTSGLSITKLSEALPEALKPRFCGIHFFNPPRYMFLVELIDTPTTQPQVLDQLEAFVTSTLGKGVVRAHDTPNFIANRVGIAGMLATLKEVERFGLTPDVVDDLTGKKLGRASSGTFRTADVVGLDTMAHVVKTLQDNLNAQTDPFYGNFATPPVLARLLELGNLGQKTKAGFFKKVGRDILRFPDGAAQGPLRQRRRGQGFTGVDVLLYPVGHVVPAGRLPDFEGTLRMTEAPLHGQVDLARGIGNGLEVDGAVMKAVAQYGPQKLSLWMFRIMQRAQLFGRIAFGQDCRDGLIDFGIGGHIFFFAGIQPKYGLAFLAVEARAGFLTQGALLYKPVHNLRHTEMAVKGILRQLILHGAYDVRQGVQADHVGGPEGAGLCAAEPRAGQFIDQFVGQAERVGLCEYRQDAKDANAIADEVGRIFGTHDALAQLRHQEGLQQIQQSRFGVRRGDEFDQGHVAGWIEEMHAAEAMSQGLGQCRRKLRNGQARGVAGDDGIVLDGGRQLQIQVALPVQPFGNGLDDQVTFGQAVQVVVVVGGNDQVGERGGSQGRGIQLGQLCNRALRYAVLVALLGRQIEKHHGHTGVHAVRRNLCAHDAGAAHRDLAHVKTGGFSGLLTGLTRLHKRTSRENRCV